MHIIHLPLEFGKCESCGAAEPGTCEDGSICLDILICGAFCPALSTTAYHARGFPPSGIMQPGGHYLQQHQQAQQMTPQSLMATRSSMLYSQQQFSALQQQQALHSQLGMSSGGSSGLHMLQSEANSSGTTGGALGAGGFPNFGRGSTGEGLQASGRGKQEIGSSEGRGGGSSGGHGGEGGESLYLKASEDASLLCDPNPNPSPNAGFPFFSFQSMLCDPNANSPANSEAALLFCENKREYNRRVREIVEQSWTED
ncbi:unnamed protein product [Camellia sinensis]